MPEASKINIIKSKEYITKIAPYLTESIDKLVCEQISDIVKQATKPDLSRALGSVAQSFVSHETTQFRPWLASILQTPPYNHTVIEELSYFKPNSSRAVGRLDLYLQTSSQWRWHQQIPTIGIELKTPNQLKEIISAIGQVGRYCNDKEEAIYRDAFGQEYDPPSLFLVCTPSSWLQSIAYIWPFKSITGFSRIDPLYEQNAQVAVTHFYKRLLWRQNVSLLIDGGFQHPVTLGHPIISLETPQSISSEYLISVIENIPSDLFLQFLLISADYAYQATVNNGFPRYTFSNCDPIFRGPPNSSSYLARITIHPSDTFFKAEVVTPLANQKWDVAGHFGLLSFFQEVLQKDWVNSYITLESRDYLHCDIDSNTFSDPEYQGFQESGGNRHQQFASIDIACNLAEDIVRFAHIANRWSSVNSDFENPKRFLVPSNLSIFERLLSDLLHPEILIRAGCSTMQIIQILKQRGETAETIRGILRKQNFSDSRIEDAFDSLAQKGSGVL